MMPGDLQNHRGDTYHIHYIGLEREVYLLPLFRELIVLFPHTRFVIEMVGPLTIDTPSTPLHYEGRLGGSLIIRVHSGVSLFYHNPALALERPVPDVIFAANAELSTPDYEWGPTLDLIQQMGAPLVFTDHSEFSVEQGLKFAALHGLQPCWTANVTGNADLNPFRAPLRYPLLNGGAVGLPWLFNGFVAAVSARGVNEPAAQRLDAC